AGKGSELALGGNMAALRICFERLSPPRRDHGVAFDLPKIESAADALAASHAVLDSCAAGILSTGEAADVMGLIATHLRAIQQADPLSCLRSSSLKALISDET